MNKALLQLWEETSKNGEIIPDGCSLHIDLESKKRFEAEIYLSRRDFELIPETFERTIGSEIEVEITDKLSEILSENNSIRLQQYEMNNLINLKEIILNDF